MKKKIRVVALVTVLGLIMGLGVANSGKVIAMSDIALVNVEALAAIPPNYTGLRYQEGELGTGGCINCPEPKDYSCTCR